MKFLIIIYFITSFFFLSQSFKTKEQSIKDGYEIYQDFCLRCHMSEGEGSKGIPPLAKSDYLFNDIENSIHVVKNGMKGEIIVNNVKYNNVMESPGLDDEEIADVMNYILNSWGNSYDKLITYEEVLKIK